MRTKHTAEELARVVRITAPGIQSAKWDGKEYDLTEGVEIQYGVAVHWMATYKGEAIAIDEIAPAEVVPRDILNPLEVNDRGEAFAGLKRPRKKAASE